MSQITQTNNNLSSIILATTKPTKQVAMKKPATKRGGRAKSRAAVKSAAKQQPLKVVYISNPMRVEASAAEFPALVQELTGRDAADWADPPELSLTIPENVRNDPHVPAAAVDSGEGDDELGYLGSDLGYFGPFDGVDDPMVVMEGFSSFYACL